MVEPAVARHFSRSAARYSWLRGAGPLSRIRSREQAAIHELATIDAGSNVLDAGCGDGATLRWLRSQGARAVGIDLTLPMAKRCFAGGHEVIVQDVEQVGLRPIFDWVLCVGSLEFVPDPARALANLGSCLAPAGRLLLLYPRKGPWGSLYALYHRSHGVHIHLFGEADIDNLFEAAGLAPPLARRDCLLSSVCTTAKKGKTGR